jgi:hypothetical protein
MAVYHSARTSSGHPPLSIFTVDPASWLVNEPMNNQVFEIYVETQLVPTLAPHDLVILDNVAFHKGATVSDVLPAPC